METTALATSSPPSVVIATPDGPGTVGFPEPTCNGDTLKWTSLLSYDCPVEVDDVACATQDPTSKGSQARPLRTSEPLLSVSPRAVHKCPPPNQRDSDTGRFGGAFVTV